MNSAPEHRSDAGVTHTGRRLRGATASHVVIDEITGPGRQEQEPPASRPARSWTTARGWAIGAWRWERPARPVQNLAFLACCYGVSRLLTPARTRVILSILDAVLAVLVAAFAAVFTYFLFRARRARRRRRTS